MNDIARKSFHDEMCLRVETILQNSDAKAFVEDEDTLRTSIDGYFGYPGAPGGKAWASVVDEVLLRLQQLFVSRRNLAAPAPFMLL